MEDPTLRFVSTEQKQPLPPPPGETGWPARIRRSLFATPLDTALTLVAALLIAYVVTNLLEWGVFNAAFVGADRTVCLPRDGHEAGACWAFVGAKFELFMYGIYPDAERWRINALLVMLVLLVVPIAIPSVPYKRLNAILLLAVFPFVALVLLTGGQFSISGGGIAFFMAVAAAITLYSASGKIGFRWSHPLVRVASGLLLLSLVLVLIAGIVSSDQVLFLDQRFSVLSIAAFAAALLSVAATVASAFGGPDGAKRAL
ncbi:MAG: amino acid ABC transporter permease, partial [Sphingomonadales bacterium]